MQHHQLSIQQDYDEDEADLDTLLSSAQPRPSERVFQDEDDGEEDGDTVALLKGTKNKKTTADDIEKGLPQSTTSSSSTKPKSIMEEDYKVSPLRILALIRPELCMILAGVVALLVSSATGLVLPGFSAAIIDAVNSGDMDRLNEVVVIMCGVFVFDGFFSMLKQIFFDLSGERIVVRLRKQVFEAVMQQEVAFFDTNKTGELINRLSSDCEVIQGALTGNLSMGIESLAHVLGGLAILFYISWKLTLVMLAVTPVVIIVAAVYGTYIAKVSKDKQDALAKSTETASESISNIRTVRSFSAVRYEIGRYGANVDISYRFARTVSISVGIFVGLMTVLVLGAIVLVLWYGGTLVIKGDMTSGVLTSFILYTVSVAASIGGLSVLAGELMKAAGSGSRIFQILDREPIDEKEGGLKIDNFKGDIALNDVEFSYPVRPDNKVLKGLSLRLEPGKVVALVGPSGSGKSTITHLIERFYTPGKGDILFDGIKAETVDAAFLRERIGLVSQEPVLFATTIADNIKYGMTRDVSQEEIEEAAKLANAHQFITEQQDGYKTLVGERGIQLSGGQKQRIAIARAILKNPQILLLDEATSALDSESEHLVQEALDRLMQGRTVLVIAHRLSTVQDADLVCVMDRGTIVEQGTHAELMLTDGLYRLLVSRQLQSEN